MVLGLQRKSLPVGFRAPFGFTLKMLNMILYRTVTRFIKNQSARAAAAEEQDPGARALGFLMALYQRRLASITWSLKKSLERRADLLEKKLTKASQTIKELPNEIPDEEDLEEMDDAEREAWEERLEAMVLARNPQEVRRDIDRAKEDGSTGRRRHQKGIRSKTFTVKVDIITGGLLRTP